MNNEIWKPVKDFEERYEVSSYGVVRDIARSKIMKIRESMYVSQCITDNVNGLRKKKKSN